MQQSKLIKVFNSLEKKELRALKKWVQSPMHNEHKDVQRLFDFLFTRHVLNSKTLKKERAWKYVYPTQVYRDLRMRHLMSFALNVLEQFVSYKSVKKNIFLQQKSLAEQYVQKKLLKPAHQTIRKAENHLLKAGPYNELYYYHQYELETLKFDLEGTQNRTRATNITEITTAASLFFMVTTLRYAYTALSHQSLQKTSYNIPLLESVLNEIEAQNYNDHPILMSYYHGYQTLKNPEDETHFRALKSYLEMPLKALGTKEKQAVLLMALNYAIKRLNTGHKSYIREAFELYRKGLVSSLLMEGGVLSSFAYKNTMSLGILLEEYDWLEYFIPTYAPYLEEETRSNFQHYSQARLFFARKQYDLAMELLIQAEYDDIMLTIGAKVMLIKLYYAQASWDALEALLESFRMFLKRKKALSYHKEHYFNMIVITKKMLYLPDFEKTAIGKLKEQVETLSPLAERDWLLEQINQKL